MRQLSAGAGNAVGCGMEYVGAESLKERKSLLAPAYQPFGGGRRGFHAHVGHIVEHGHVAFMANPDNDRQRKLGHVKRQIVVVESLQVACGASSSYDDHAVPVVALGRYGLESGYDGGRRALSCIRAGKRRVVKRRHGVL